MFKIDLKKLLPFVLLFILVLSSQALADTLNLKTLPVTQAGGYYVGAVGGNLNGGTAANYYCDDFATTTYVPSSFAVLVSTLSDISGTKFAGQANALQKYREAAWLMYEMQINPAKVAALQFAMWSVFDPATPTFADSAYWLDASTKINAADYDFSKVRIYTATDTKNQEFMGGTVTGAPEPAEWMLILIGLGLTGFYLRRKGLLGLSVQSPA